MTSVNDNNDNHNIATSSNTVSNATTGAASPSPNSTVPTTKTTTSTSTSSVVAPNNNIHNKTTSAATTTTTKTQVQIPCCLCGTLIYPNAANQCSSCLASSMNLQQRLQSGPGNAPHSTIYQCRTCRRYQKKPTQYVDCEPESPELLSICLQHIPALKNNNNSESKLHLMDAHWIWTEPHSMRFQVHLTIRTEYLGVILQQRVKVELHCQFQMCSDCNREYTNRTYHAIVQVRQKPIEASAPKTGLVALEQALANNKEIRKHVLKMDHNINGFDFYFLSYPKSQLFVSYLQRMIPMKVSISQKMVSEDIKNSTANMKYTITCDVIPLCRHDLIVVHKSLKHQALSGKLVLATKVSGSVVHLIDASPLLPALLSSTATTMGDVNASHYFKNEKLYRVLLSSNRLIRYVVLDVEPIVTPQQQVQKAAATDAPPDEVLSLVDGTVSTAKVDADNSIAWADVVVARESDMGVNDRTWNCVTHLGRYLNSGDVVLGYDLVSSSISAMMDGSSSGVGSATYDIESSLNHHVQWPDVVLVKKVTESKGKGKSKGGDIATVEDNEEGVKPSMTKKQARRRRKYEGKRRKALEASAQRMGFLEQEDDDEVDTDEAQADAEGRQIMEGAEPIEGTGDYHVEDDAEMTDNVEALERELAALDAKFAANEEEG